MISNRYLELLPVLRDFRGSSNTWRNKFRDESRFRVSRYTVSRELSNMLFSDLEIIKDILIFLFQLITAISINQNEFTSVKILELLKSYRNYPNLNKGQFYPKPHINMPKNLKILIKICSLIFIKQ